MKRVPTIADVMGTFSQRSGFGSLSDCDGRLPGMSTSHYVLDPAGGLTQVLSDGTNTYLYGNGRVAQYQAAMQYFGADGLGSSLS